jgi:hypothetical protein
MDVVLAKPIQHCDVYPVILVAWPKMYGFSRTIHPCPFVFRRRTDLSHLNRLKVLRFETQRPFEIGCGGHVATMRTAGWTNFCPILA